MTALAVVPPVTAADEEQVVLGPAERCQEDGCIARARFVVHVLFSCTSTRVCHQHVGDVLARVTEPGEPTYVTISALRDGSD